MPTIPLVNRLGDIVAEAQVDEADHGALVAHRWGLHSMGYAARKVDGYRLLMHRAIAGLEPGDGLEVDHINRDRLDNRRANLRVCTHAENGQNVPALTDHGRGVSPCRTGWIAKGGSVHLGVFSTALEAASAAARWRSRNMTHSVEDAALLAGPDPVPRANPWMASAEARREQFGALWRDGLNATEIAKECGCTPQVIHAVVKRTRQSGDFVTFPYRADAQPLRTAA